jgi:D-alanine--poly(phosphoribitol) ligase subunit 1
MPLIGQKVRLPPQPLAHQAFESHAARDPGRLALSCGAESRSYAELNERANQFAYYLREKGLGAGSVVGICLDRSVEMMVSILGTLKAGAAYAPLDSTYPAKRLDHMISQLSAMNLVTASPDTFAMVRGNDAEVVDMAAIGPRLDSFPVTNPAVAVSGSDICYVIFTSGSTGVPKAVAVRHEGWFNLLNWVLTEFGLTTESSGLLMSPFGFDITQRGLMSPLFAGAALHLLPSRNFDAMMASRVIRERRIRTLHCAPSALYLLLERAEAQGTDTLASLDYAFVGGEPIATGRVDRWATRPGNQSRLVNVYGVAECTDVATAHVLADYAGYAVRGVPIGQPIYNVDIHVLDEDLEPVAPHEVGEICIAGMAVGAGYLNDLGMNEMRFVQRDFGQGQITLYRTGDMGRIGDDGELVYAGRADKQVKIRGMRVDLGDIEAALASCEHVGQAVVVSGQADGSSGISLVAFVVPPDKETPGAPLDQRAIRLNLLRVLPAHMVPSRFFAVSEFPLSPNGKVDRGALALRLRESTPAGDYGIPQDPETLCSVATNVR